MTNKDIPNISKGGDYTVFYGSNEKGTRAYERFKNKTEAKKFATELQKKGEEGITIDAYDADGDLFGKTINVPQLSSLPKTGALSAQEAVAKNISKVVNN